MSKINHSDEMQVLLKLVALGDTKVAVDLSRRVHRLHTELASREAEIAGLRARVADAETALRVWDEGYTSEYWERSVSGERPAREAECVALKTNPRSTDHGMIALIRQRQHDGVYDAGVSEDIDTLLALIAALSRTESEMRGALKAARDKFREYEALHIAKGSIDGDAKARANCEMAELCERAISTASDT